MTDDLQRGYEQTPSENEQATDEMVLRGETPGGAGSVIGVAFVVDYNHKKKNYSIMASLCGRLQPPVGFGAGAHNLWWDILMPQ